MRQGQEFSAIEPLLWLHAGGVGQRAQSDPTSSFSIAKESEPDLRRVLFQRSAYANFLRALKASDRIEHVFLVTDSEDAYRQMRQRLPDGVEASMLYRDYLTNFRINTVGGVPMKFTLLRFQETTVADALTNVRLAMDEVSRVGLNGAGQVVTLVAPTGAGKTVMAAAILESLLEGDESHTADEALTVVWLSDLPRVNEQTAKPVKAASDKINESHFVHIDTDFSEDELAPSRIYFLNTQKLSITSGLVSDSEDRSYTIWEVLNRTIQREPSKFLLVLDEAHRGMDRSAAPDAPNSIVQRFILGNEALTASPTILGTLWQPPSGLPTFWTEPTGLSKGRRLPSPMSARPDSSRNASSCGGRSTALSTPSTRCSSELRRTCKTTTSGGGSIRKARASRGTIAPILVVQVEDKTSDKISATDLEQAIEAIEEILGPQSPDSFAHSFGDAPVEALLLARHDGCAI